MSKGKMFSFEFGLRLRPTDPREDLGFEVFFTPEKTSFRSTVRFSSTEDGATEGVEKFLEAIGAHIRQFMEMRRQQETRTEAELKEMLWALLDLSLAEVNLRFPQGSSEHGYFKVHPRTAKRFLAQGIEFVGQLVMISQFEFRRFIPEQYARMRFERQLQALDIWIGMTSEEVYQWQPRAVRQGG